MKTPYTPGPWKTVGSGTGKQDAVWTESNDEIAQFKNERDAQLGAAAPELAEALEWMLRAYLSLGGKLAEESPQVAASKAALRKAGLLPA